MIDGKVVSEYLELTGAESLDTRIFTVVTIEERYPVERVRALLNRKEGQDA